MVNSAAATEAAPTSTTPVSKMMTPRVQRDAPDGIRPLAAAAGIDAPPVVDAGMMYRGTRFSRSPARSRQSTRSDPARRSDRTPNSDERPRGNGALQHQHRNHDRHRHHVWFFSHPTVTDRFML